MANDGRVVFGRASVARADAPRESAEFVRCRLDRIERIRIGDVRGEECARLQWFADQSEISCGQGSEDILAKLSPPCARLRGILRFRHRDLKIDVFRETFDKAP